MTKKTSLVYTVHNNYLIFRSSIESLFAHVDLDGVYEILIVDDCSSEKIMIEFLDYLDNIPIVRVIKAGDPADYSFHNDRQSSGRPASSILDSTSSLGHGVAQNIGIENTKTKFALFVDSDILFMPKAKDIVLQLEQCMSLDEKVMSVGQLVGEIRGVRVIDKPFNLCGEEGQLIKTRGGWPVHILVMSRMSGWNNHGLTKMCNGGWTNENHIPSLWKNGFKTCNFDIFIEGYAIHLGYATLRHTRDILNKQKIVYCKDGGGYSQSRGSWYGYKFVPLTTDEFLKLLEDSYANVAFDTRLNIVTWE